MSTSTGQVPQTSTRAIGLVTLIGVAAVSVYEPIAGVGALSGALLAGTIALSSRRQSYIIPAACLTAGTFGTIVAVAVASTLRTEVVVLTALSVPLGIGLSSLFVDSKNVEMETISQAPLYGFILASLTTVLTSFDISEIRQIGFETLGIGPASPVWWAFPLASLFAGLGIGLVPPPAFAGPDEKQSFVTTKRTLAVVVVVLGMVPAPMVLMGAVVSEFELMLSAISVVLVSLLGLGVVLTGYSLFARWQWYQPDNGRDRSVPILIGTIIGFSICLGALSGASRLPELQETLSQVSWATLSAVLAGLFLTSWLVLSWYNIAREGGVAPSPSFVISLSLGSIGIVLGTTLPATAPTGIGVGGIATLIAIGAGLFVYEGGRYGQTLGSEVRPTGATARSQLVELGWLGTVVTVGVVLAGVALIVTRQFAPTLSVAASAGILAGTLALLSGIWLLLRE